MRKIIPAALLAVMLAGAAAPAFAEDVVFGHSVTYTTQAIEALGYKVSDIEEWGSLIKATVVDSAGHQSFKYFDPDTMVQVG